MFRGRTSTPRPGGELGDRRPPHAGAAEGDHRRDGDQGRVIRREAQARSVPGTIRPATRRRLMKKTVSRAVGIVGATACVAVLLLLARKDDSRTSSQPAIGARNSPKAAESATLAAQAKKVVDAG